MYVYIARSWFYSMRVQVACLPSREELTPGLLQRMFTNLSALMGQFYIAPQRVPSKMETWVPTAVASTAVYTVVGFWAPPPFAFSVTFPQNSHFAEERPGCEAFLPGGIEN